VNYLDANFVAALYFNIPGQTELAEKFLRKNSRGFIFTDLAELECRRAFITRSGTSNSESWQRLQASLKSGSWRRTFVEWPALREKTAHLVDLHGAAIRAGTLDTMHVAAALLLGCNTFLSFDTNSHARALALKCRLKVFPEM
jgi:predicted nucleic acid-binding protein